MASSEEFVQYVVGQLDEAGNIIYKKLFGEYGLWLNGKFFGLLIYLHPEIRRYPLGRDLWTDFF